MLAVSFPQNILEDFEAFSNLTPILACQNMVQWSILFFILSIVTVIIEKMLLLRDKYTKKLFLKEYR